MDETNERTSASQPALPTDRKYVYLFILLFYLGFKYV